MQNVGYKIQLIYKTRYIKIVLYLDIKCIPPTCTNFLKYIYLISLWVSLSYSNMRKWKIFRKASNFQEIFIYMWEGGKSSFYVIFNILGLSRASILDQGSDLV